MGKLGRQTARGVGANQGVRGPQAAALATAAAAAEGGWRGDKRLADAEAEYEARQPAGVDRSGDTTPFSFVASESVKAVASGVGGAGGGHGPGAWVEFSAAYYNVRCRGMRNIACGVQASCGACALAQRRQQQRDPAPAPICHLVASSKAPGLLRAVTQPQLGRNPHTPPPLSSTPCRA